MGSGCSGRARQAGADGPALTGEQWRDILRYARPDLVDDEPDTSPTPYARGDSFSKGAWWWGHARASKQPAEVHKSTAVLTAPLPPYYRDLLRLQACPSYLDSLCWENGGTCPFMGGTAYVHHDDVARLLAECPRELIAGRIHRKSELAYVVLSDSAFASSGCLGLANDPSKHRLQRHWCQPLLQRMPGPCGLLKEAHDFLLERTAISCPKDIFRWWTQLLWRHMLECHLSSDEADAFNSFRDQWAQAATVHVSDLSIAHLNFTMAHINVKQLLYRSKIEALLPKFIPGEATEDVAQAVLEMLAFAGGVAVPQTITACVAAFYQEELMPEPLTPDNVAAFVYEVTRVFPAVSGFPFWRDGHRHILSLSAALLDPAVWGDEADKFTLKELSLYQSAHVGFAEQAVAENPDDSRACPGKHIALDAAKAFMLALSESGLHWRPVGGVRGIEAGGKTSWWRPFTLERLPPKEALRLEEMLDGDHTGEESLRSIGPVRAQAMLARIDQDLDGLPDVLRQMDVVTRIFYAAAKRTWVSNPEIEKVETPFGPALGPFTEKNSVELDFGGIRLPTSDEQWTGTPWAKELSLKLFKRLTSFMGDDISDSLRLATEEQAMEAIMSAQQAFLRPAGGSYLPSSTAPWGDLEGDRAQALLAMCGPGQLLLRSNSDPSLQEYGEVVCDVSLLGSASVRPAFERLGAAAFFKRDSSGHFSITAIDWKHENRIVTPSDAALWRHAKFAWRSSIGTMLTLVHHLTWTHWIVANAVVSSVREALGPQHPIRRLLHANTYNTAGINYMTYWTLFPRNGFLHHISPFTYDGMTFLFEAAHEQYRFRTWPQLFEEFDLPEEVKRSLPIFEDGLPVWNALHEFYAAYLDLYYASDAAVQADQELQAYWKFQSVPQYAKGLPPLSKAALADQLAQAVFDITAYHEFVGHVIGVLSDPRGCFMQVRPGLDMADKQHLIQVLSLAASTGSPMPRFLDDWSWLLDLGHLAPQNHFKEAKALWDRLRARLTEVSAEIKQRNLGRPRPFCQFDPEYFECSVSL